MTITDPQTNNRTWTLVYESGLLTEVRDPMYPQDPSKHFWQFTYDATGRILSLADKEGDAFTYEYSSAGRLSRATDPGTLSGQFQQWRYIAYTVRPHGEEDYYQKTTYTDRRGNKWTLHFDFRDDLLKFANPLAERVLLDHQASHEVIQYTDPMNRCWDST